MIQIPGPIPILIHPFFWIFAALIGWINSQSLMGMAIWVGIIFVSVLFHEFGHALMAMIFRQRARIQLIAFGGVTSFEGPKLKFWQQFLVTLNGPLFGFLLFVAATFLLRSQIAFSPLTQSILKMTQIANLFWTAVNLLPVLPLDGGQLLRIFLESIFGVKGFKASLLIGAAVAVLLSFYFFFLQAFLAGAFFFLFAFQSFDLWRKSKGATRSDREEDNKRLLLEAERALEEGKVEEAKAHLEQVRQKASGGLLAHAASQYLAFLLLREGKSDEAYELLLSIKEHLSEDSLCLLHRLAAERKNAPLVVELSAKCFQIAPSQQMALHNARAFASLNQPQPAGGWLQTAWQYGTFDLAAVLQEEAFAHVKHDPKFRDFTDQLQ